MMADIMTDQFYNPVEDTGGARFKRVKTDTETKYVHHSGHWYIHKVHVTGYRRMHWGAVYTGPTREAGCTPKLPICNTLVHLKGLVEKYFEANSEHDYKKRAVARLSNGDIAAAVDCIFSYIDSKFSDLEDEIRSVDSRLDNVRF